MAKKCEYCKGWGGLPDGRHCPVCDGWGEITTRVPFYGRRIYFGFAIADSMFSFPESVVIRREYSSEEIEELLGNCEKERVEIIPCLNPSHVPTIEALYSRFPSLAKFLYIPEKAPKVSLGIGEALIVMYVRGLPRLEGRHEYTDSEISQCTFSFSLWYDITDC